MSLSRLLILGFALAGLALALWTLERLRGGLAISHDLVGTTPVTVYVREGAAPAPAVVIAHGFAGSRQLMEAYALTLAHAGYVAVTFDFEGHGRNPTPMSGDVTAVEGTTQLLMAETGRVTNHALSLPQSDGRVALLGHSMASDVIVRQTIADPRIAATVAISMFSQAVAADRPARLLAITGEWEAALRAEALRTLRLVDGTAKEGDTARSEGVLRRAVVAPSVEHVGVLYSATGLREATAWLDTAFDRQSGVEAESTGPWIALLLVSVVALAWPCARLLPQGPRPAALRHREAILIPLGAAVVTPLVLAPFNTRFLPVLVADYLALHLLVYGALVLLALRFRKHPAGRFSVPVAVALAVFGILVFGAALDRYVASFVPTAARVPIIAVIALGAVPFMIADAQLGEAGRAPLWRRLLIKLLFLASLGLAVALDFERLFFLVIIFPVILLFFLVFGTVGGWAGRRSGSALAVGAGLGLVLAWALGVSFPMFAQEA